MNTENQHIKVLQGVKSVNPGKTGNATQLLILCAKVSQK